MPCAWLALLFGAPGFLAGAAAQNPASAIAPGRVILAPSVGGEVPRTVDIRGFGCAGVLPDGGDLPTCAQDRRGHSDRLRHR